MRLNKIKQLWREGQPATAGWLSTGNTFLAEIMAHAGFDAVIIDMQHGMGLSPEKAIQCMQAISTTDTVPVVRMSWNDPKDIQFVLDAGAYGVIVPLVNTKAETELAVGAAKYPPIGFRSIGPNRARLYGGPDYVQHANDETFVLVMIETMEAVNNLEEIASVPGLDGFYVGPGDLAVSLGLTPGPDARRDPRHAEACQRVVDVARAHGLIPCHHGSGPEEAADRFAQGFMMCQIGSDSGMVANASASALKTLTDLRA
ncbi:MAG: aldolase/citrate lyase family protein [Chloroflexota bacterium]|jgi:4-hydroxy-2-oxoheptanedioate aldolase|nr:aldolase/citrate lyase family protein [Chloroflexota bacterium]